MSELSASPPPHPPAQGRFHLEKLASNPLPAPAPTTPFFLSFLIACCGLGALAAGLYIFKITVLEPSLLPPAVLVETPWNTSEPEPPTPPVSTPVAQYTPPVAQPLPPIEQPPPPPPPTDTTVISSNQLALQASWTLDTIEEISELQAEELRKQKLEEERERERLAKLEKERREREKKEAAERARRAEIAAREKAARAARNREIAAQRQAEQERAAAAARQQAEQRRQAALAKKVVNTPSVTRRVPPSYPASARRSGVEGTTRIAATITTSGKVASPRIIASSGHRSLDSAAIKAVKKWRFTPAKNALGQPVPHQINIPITFRLN